MDEWKRRNQMGIEGGKWKGAKRKGRIGRGLRNSYARGRRMGGK
jgi:hypothetical protein